MSFKLNQKDQGYRKAVMMYRRKQQRNRESQLDYVQLSRGRIRYKMKIEDMRIAA